MYKSVKQRFQAIRKCMKSCMVLYRKAVHDDNQVINCIMGMCIISTRALILLMRHNLILSPVTFSAQITCTKNANQCIYMKMVKALCNMHQTGLSLKCTSVSINTILNLLLKPPRIIYKLTTNLHPLPPPLSKINKCKFPNFGFKSKSVLSDID